MHSRSPPSSAPPLFIRAGVGARGLGRAGRHPRPRGPSLRARAVDVACRQHAAVGGAGHAAKVRAGRGRGLGGRGKEGGTARPSNFFGGGGVDCGPHRPFSLSPPPRCWRPVPPGSFVPLAALAGHTLPISALCLLPSDAPSPLVASSSWDKTVRVWDLSSGACLQVCGGVSGVMPINPMRVWEWRLWRGQRAWPPCSV